MQHFQYKLVNNPILYYGVIATLGSFRGVLCFLVNSYFFTHIICQVVSGL